MASQLDEKVIRRAKAVALFEGEAEYYFPDGNATNDERNHLINTIVENAVDRLDARRAGGD